MLTAPAEPAPDAPDDTITEPESPAVDVPDAKATAALGAALLSVFVMQTEAAAPASMCTSPPALAAPMPAPPRTDTLPPAPAPAPAPPDSVAAPAVDTDTLPPAPLTPAPTAKPTDPP